MQNSSHPSTVLSCGLAVLPSRNGAIWVLDLARVGTAQETSSGCSLCSLLHSCLKRRASRPCYVIRAKHKELHLFSSFSYSFVFVSLAPAESRVLLGPPAGRAEGGPGAEEHVLARALPALGLNVGFILRKVSAHAKITPCILLVTRSHSVQSKPSSN